MKEGFNKKKKKEKEPKSNPPEQVCAVKVVAISEPKVSEVEKGGLSWKPKCKKVEIISDSHPKLLEYVLSLEIACKNLLNVCGEIKNSQGALHNEINPG